MPTIWHFYYLINFRILLKATSITKWMGSVCNLKITHIVNTSQQRLHYLWTLISPHEPIKRPITWQNVNTTPHYPYKTHVTALFCSMVLYPKSSSIDRRTSELKNNRGNWYKTFWQLTLVFLAVSDKKLKISCISEDLEMANLIRCIVLPWPSLWICHVIGRLIGSCGEMNGIWDSSILKVSSP